jgi:RimJ/RimL family protein N-acetyltransferase
MPKGAQPGPEDFPAWLTRRRQDMDREAEAGYDVHWCIAEAASDAMVGNVQIFRMGPVPGRFQGELGYWLRPGARGRGFIGEAVKPVVAYALTPVEDGGLGLIRLHAATDSDNHASQSILRSAGFTQWGADHQAWRRTDGSLSDGVYFELLASDASDSADERDPTMDGTVDCNDDSLLNPSGVEPVTLEGKGIRLRKWRHADAHRTAEACSDPRTQHWLTSLPSPYTLEDAHFYIARRSVEAREGNGLYWCVADAKSDLCLGGVGMMDLRDALGTAGEIGYWTHPDARGSGVMTEAVRLAVRHAFISSEEGGLGRQRLRLNAAHGNSASQHIALANGFVEVGRDRRAQPLGDGTFVDVVRFDLLVDEWNAHL